MGSNKHTYSPQQVESLTGVPRDTQRDWRRRGLIHDWGRQSKTGRWKYTFEEVMAFYLTDRLSLTGMELQYAAELGTLSGAALVRWLQGVPSGPRYLGVRSRTKPTAHPSDPLIEEFLGKAGITYANSLAEWDGIDFDWLEVVDLEYVARSAPPILRDEALNHGVS